MISMIRKAVRAARSGSIALFLCAFVFLLTDAAIHGFPRDEFTIQRSGTMENPEMEAEIHRDTLGT
ncbi:MAG: hypothetical protein NXI24_10770 [bacterium]|nr:hypothetical protein [bacterium]